MLKLDTVAEKGEMGNEEVSTIWQDRGSKHLKLYHNFFLMVLEYDAF